MPDIQSLTLRVQGLNQSVDAWNLAMIWALVFAAIAALAVVVTTRTALTQSKKLAEAQAELMQAKDSQLVLDLRDKDLKIKEASGKVADLQIAAANAKAVQQRVETELSKQQTRAANAERELLLIKERMRPTLTEEQRTQLLTALKNGPKGKLQMGAVFSDSGAMYLAELLMTIFREAGWEVGEPGLHAVTVHGVHMVVQVRDATKASAQAFHLVKCLREIGLSVVGESKPDMAEDGILLIIGPMP